MSKTLLSIKDIEVFYGPSQALFGVSLEVNEGEVVALMGRNGMGKTTTIRSLCKMSKPVRGDIQFDGTLINKMPSHKVAKLGVGLGARGATLLFQPDGGRELGGRAARWRMDA